jgi:1-deoxy-D-xylulose-5-phosphate reductoisomerase
VVSVAPRVNAEPKRITILGATGSVGTSTLSVIGQDPDAFLVDTVTAHTNAAQLAEVAHRAGARLAVIADPSMYGELKEALSGSGIAAAAGPDAVTEAARRPVDLVLAAIVGAAGLAPTFAALSAGTTIALANKECLVGAGDLFIGAARRRNVAILPVDSEHNAIFQILEGRQISDVERIVVTASGGPFRQWPREAMAAATPDEALAHPNWSMGPKITIDSATMMNKGLELIEAHHLFGMPSSGLDVLVHPQSVIHGMVAFRDGSMMASMSPPDMRTPIAHCLAWPDRSSTAHQRLDLAAIGDLRFEAPDPQRFPALTITRQALDAGGWATNILSAANEIAVEAFLAGRIGFLEIARLVEDTIAAAAAVVPHTAPSTIAEAIALDREGRRIAADLLTRVSAGRD